MKVPSMGIVALMFGIISNVISKQVYKILTLYKRLDAMRSFLQHRAIHRRTASLGMEMAKRNLYLSLGVVRLRVTINDPDSEYYPSVCSSPSIALSPSRPLLHVDDADFFQHS